MKYDEILKATADGQKTFRRGQEAEVKKRSIPVTSRQKGWLFRFKL